MRLNIIVGLVLSVIPVAGFSFDSLVLDPNPERYRDQIEVFVAWENSHSVPKGNIVFVGSSSIRGWNTRKNFSGQPILNHGFGGSHISDINHFIDETVLNYWPKTVVFYAGENDIAGGKTSDRVFADYTRFVGLVMEQDEATKVVFISIKPSPKRWSFWGRMTETNEKVRAYSDLHENLFYVDVSAAMLDEGGELRASLYVKDGIHMNQNGYDIWTKLVSNVLREIH